MGDESANMQTFVNRWGESTTVTFVRVKLRPSGRSSDWKGANEVYTEWVMRAVHLGWTAREKI